MHHCAECHASLLLLNCVSASLLQVLDYRQIGPNCEVLGAGTGSANAALLPVSHNRTGKVYLAVVAVRDITAGTEVTFDHGTASYVGCMNAVLHCRLSSQQQQQHHEKLKSTKAHTEQQQQQQMSAAEAAAERRDLPVHPVPAGDDVPAGKLHKSLMSQLLAALATCRKLPASNACHAHRNALDKLLQQAVTLAHEAVVAASAAAPAMQQLSPREMVRTEQQQQQQSGRVSPAMQQQVSPRETSGMQQQQVTGNVSAAVQQLLSGRARTVKAEAAAAAEQRDLAAAESCNLSGASSTPSAPRTPTFGGFLDDAVAADAARQQQQQQGSGASRALAPAAGAATATAFATAAGAAAVAAAAEEDERLFGTQLTEFGSAESFESMAAAAVRPSRWSHSLSAAVEVSEDWQQGDADADLQDYHEQQQQQRLARTGMSLLDDCCNAQQQQQQQRPAGFESDGQECGGVCAGSVQANIQPLVRQLIR
jgi:hypothetical protein